MTYYIINYKETTLDENNNEEIECGTFEYGYQSIDKALKKIQEASDDVMNDFIYDGKEKSMFHESNKENDYHLCSDGVGKSFEYWISNLTIEE